MGKTIKDRRKVNDEEREDRRKAIFSREEARKNKYKNYFGDND